MASIGSLAVTLTANAAAFEAALDKAASKAEEWGGKVSRLLAEPFQAMRKALAVPGAAVEGFLKPVADLAKGIPFIGSALAAVPTTGADFITFLKDSADEMLAVKRMAEQAGVPLREFSALIGSLSAERAEELAHSITRLNRFLGDVAGGNPDAAKRARLLGLDPAQLAQSDTISALKLIFDNLKSVENEAIRAQRAMDLFGDRTGHQILPFAAKGGAGVDEMIAKGEGLGKAFGLNEIQDVIKAKEALRDIENAVAGVGRRLAIELSPYIRLAAEGFRDLITSGGGFKGVITTVVDVAAGALAGFLDILQGVYKRVRAIIGALADLLDTLQGAYKAVREIAPDIKGLKPDIKGLKDVPGEVVQAGLKAPPEAKWGDSVRNARDALKNRLGQADALPGNADADRLKNFIARANELEDTIRKQTAAFGLSGAELEVWRAKVNGIPADVLKGARAAAEAAEQVRKAFADPVQAGRLEDQFQTVHDRLHRLFQDGQLDADGLHNGMKKLREDFDALEKSKAADLFRATRTPLENLKDQIADLQDLKNNGRLADGVFERALADALKKAEDAIPKPPAPRALERGTAEEYSFRAEAERRNETKDQLERIKNVLDGLKNLDQERNQVLQQILRAFGQARQAGLFEI